MSTSMCLCVCLWVGLSVCPRRYFPNHTRDLYQFFVYVAYGRGSVLWRDDKIPKGRDSFGGFFPIDNALYSVAFGTLTKTAEPIEMPFGKMTQVSHRYYVLYREPDPQGKGQFSGVVRAIRKHWQSLLQRSLRRHCRVCCKRYHPIANNVMQQKGSISTPCNCK